MRRRTLLIAFVIIAMLALPGAAMAQEETEDTIIASSSSDVVTWNPVLTTDGPSTAAQGWIYQTVVAEDPFTGEPVPAVAASWDISEDGRTYTMHLRDDVFWSDGEPIDANDVKFTFDAIMSDKVETVRKGQIDIESVEVIDDYTVAFTFPDASCEALDQIGTYILPAHKFAPDFEDFMDNPFNLSPDISAGPYILNEWVPDDYVHYVANASYVPTYPGVGTPANIENYYRRVMVQESTVLAALKAEEIDYGSITAENFNEMSQVEYLNIVEFPRDVVFFFAINNADPDNPQPAYDESGNLITQEPHPLFGDKRVREALAIGWDKETAIDVAIEGHGSVVLSALYPAMKWAYNTEIEPRAYDPEAAAALLEEAGWVDTDGDGILDKDGVPFSFEFLLDSGGGQWETIALLAQDNWRQLGIDMQINSVEWGTLVGELVNQTYDMTIIGFGGGAQPDGQVRSLFLTENDVPGEGFNFGSYINPELDELINQGLYMPGCATEDRAAVYYKIQEILFEDIPFDFIYDNTGIVALNQRVQGYDPAAGTWDFTYNLTDWTLQKAD